MEENKEKLMVTCIIVSVLLFFGVYFWVSYRLDQSNAAKLEKNGLFTIGYISEVKKTPKNTIIYYNYYVNNARLESEKYLPRNFKLKDRKFYVRFLFESFKTNKILLDQPVKKEFDKVPKLGWKRMPK